MKRIAVVTMGVALDNEKGYTRFRFLSSFLVQNGFCVDLITTTFQHWTKQQRNTTSILEKWDHPYGLKFIYEPGYKKNVDIKRVFSHHIAAKNIARYFKESEKYDLIYAEIPPNDVAKAIAKYCEKNNIPFVVDVNDLWPEAMRMVLDWPIVSDIVFYPLYHDAEYVYSRVSGVVGTSDEYRDRPFKKNNKNSSIPKETVYVGNEIEVFDKGVNDNKTYIVKGGDEYWVTYAGTLGKSYDIKTIIYASEIIRKRGNKNIKFQILGGGPDEEGLKALAKKIDSDVHFLGYQPYCMMAAYLAKSDILVNSFVKKAPQSIVTKIGDYLAAGKPMINTCSSIEFREKVEKDNFGINIEAENPEVLANTILKIYQDKDYANLLGENARYIAESQFDRKESYKKIVSLINKLLRSSNSNAR